MVLEHLSLSEELLQPDKERQCQEDSHILYLKILFLSFVLKDEISQKTKTKKTTQTRNYNVFIFPRVVFYREVLHETVSTLVV